MITETCDFTMWIFGYGSLIWKVDFPFEIKMLGFINGYKRRFYQHSTDHRGTPEKPGRVVTLIPADKNSRVYGIAYKIKENDVENVINHLDYREKGGYERKFVIFHPYEKEQEPFEITVYLGSHNNINYAGPADLNDIAQTIVKSVGPSGPNIDYIFNLANSMRTLFPNVEDKHLYTLEQKVCNLLKLEKS